MKKLLFIILLPLHLVLFAQQPARSGKGEPASFRIIYGKLVYVPGKRAAAEVPAPTARKFIGTGKGMGVLTLDGLSNTNMKIKPGTYSGIDIINPKHVKIDARDVIIEAGTLDIFQATDLEISGLSLINHNYRAVNIRGFCNKLYFHDMNFKNIANTTISYEYNGIYDGTDKTASMDWKFERLTFENTGTGFSAGGGFDSAGIRNLLKNFKFLNCTIRNNQGIGNIVYSGAMDNYEIAYNTIDNINHTFPSNAPNGIHNGIFMIMGNGSFHDNLVKNHQGNAIRAWGMSYNNKVGDISIYNNVVWNSWKYSAFEIQVTPDMAAFLKSYPQWATYTNARVYNNTAGHLNTSKDWEGQMIDVYNTGGGTLQYYNNLGFEMNRSQGEITNMINFNGETKLIKNAGNRYFKTMKQAIRDTLSFRSLYKGIGANRAVR
jgi:hypothetical protein